MNLGITPSLTTQKYHNGFVNKKLHKQQSFGIFGMSKPEMEVASILVGTAGALLSGLCGVLLVSQHSQNNIKNSLLNAPNVTTAEFIRMSDEVASGKTWWAVNAEKNGTASKDSINLDNAKKRFFTNNHLSKKDIALAYSECGKDVNCWGALDIEKLHLPKK